MFAFFPEFVLFQEIISIWSRRADSGPNRNNLFSIRQIRQRYRNVLVLLQSDIRTFVLSFLTLLFQSKLDISSFCHSTNQASSLSPPANLGKTRIFPVLYLASAQPQTLQIFIICPKGCTLFLLWNVEGYHKLLYFSLWSDGVKDTRRVTTFAFYLNHNYLLFFNTTIDTTPFAVRIVLWQIFLFWVVLVKPSTVND
jgi:hypothetical protein